MIQPRGKFRLNLMVNKIHENRAKLVWECNWCKQIKRSRLYIFDNYPHKDFDVQKIDKIVKSSV